MTVTASAPVPAGRSDGRPPGAGRPRRWIRGRAGDPAWVRPALLGLLAATGLLYLWDLSASGWANAYYSAAVQAASQDWTAFFYGSSDAGNSITVDKPPAALWVMALSVRLFGLSSWSILAPQALMGVATVGVLYLGVRRVAGPGAALLAGAAMALSPVAALMFRFNNPDALMVLLLTGAAYALVRAVERAGGRWLVLVGVLVGMAFLTKMLQAMLVVPWFGLAYLVAAPTSLGRRLLQLAAAASALVVSAGWWVAVVELVPASARPYVGGSQTDSVWELIWGYNGVGRLTGGEIGSVGPAGGWGGGSLLRMFGAEVGGQVAWLLPAALLLGAAGLVVVGRAPRTDLRRAALLAWGGWLLVSALVFSLMDGIFHAYYAVALAPAIAALVGIGGGVVWRRRHRAGGRWVLAGAVAGTAVWSWVLLARSAEFLPELRWGVLVVGVAAGLGLLVVHRVGRRLAAAGLALGVVACLAGPAAYAVQTAGTAHTGAIPSAGPAVAGTAGPGGGLLAPPPSGRADGSAVPRPGVPGRNVTVLPGGGRPDGAPGATGGLPDAGRVSEEVAALLGADAGSYTWAAATVGSNSAAGYQLATGQPVMAVGGFNGSDPAPTLEQFQRYVAEGRVHWFIGGGAEMRSPTGSDAGAAIAAWVAENFASRTVDGVILYDLTRPLA